MHVRRHTIIDTWLFSAESLLQTTDSYFIFHQNIQELNIQCSSCIYITTMTFCSTDTSLLFPSNPWSSFLYSSYDFCHGKRGVRFYKRKRVNWEDDICIIYRIIFPNGADAWQVRQKRMDHFYQKNAAAAVEEQLRILK